MKYNGWKLTDLKSEVDLLTGHPFKSNDYTENVDDILLLRGDNIAQGYLRWDGVKRWSSEKIEELESYFLKEDDIVVAMDRPWIESGLKYAYVSPKDLPSLLVQRVSRLRANKSLNQTFLRYVIGSRDFTKHVLSVQTGTTVPHISSSQIKEFEFLLPPLEEQKRIADVLSCLDAKIENLRRQNETLEEIARSIFKHWFIDFEFPNPDGKPYKSSGGAMVRSDLGDIPEGWQVGKLGDVVEVFMGYPFKSDLYTFESGTRVVRGENVSLGFLRWGYLHKPSKRGNKHIYI
jgi:type I restriction enzyme, S subunit